MTKPWDNEPTPLTDAASQLWTTTGDEYHDAVKSADVRKIERRMRAAERLIKIGGRWDGNYDWERWRRECNEHIEAAFKEDNP